MTHNLIFFKKINLFFNFIRFISIFNLKCHTFIKTQELDRIFIIAHISLLYFETKKNIA